MVVVVVDGGGNSSDGGGVGVEAPLERGTLAGGEPREGVVMMGGMEGEGLRLHVLLVAVVVGILMVVPEARQGYAYKA